MVRAVVTGAAGFLGGALAHALRGQGAEVVALDIRRAPGVVQADICRPGEWERALDGADLVIHAAAVGTGGVAELTPVRPGRAGAPLRVSPAEVRRVTLGGTATLLDAATRAGVGRFLHLSCVDVLPSPSAGGPPPDESSPVGLTGNARADTLAAAEQAVGSAVAHGLGATVLRIGDAYGPRAGRWTLWPVLLLRAGRFVLVGGGRGLVSPVHVDDVVAAVTTVAAADRDAVAGTVLHVTGGAPVTAAEFFGYYSRMLDLPAPRSVPARVLEAAGTLHRVSLLAQGYRERAEPTFAAGGAPAPQGVSRPASGLVRGLGGRLVAGVDPRARIDIGALGIRDLTREVGFAADRIRELTGWEPGVPLSEGMARTEAWLRERGLLGVREPSRRG